MELFILLFSFSPVIVYYVVKVDKFYSRKLTNSKLINLDHGISNALSNKHNSSNKAA